MTVVRYLIVAFVAAPLFACSKGSRASTRWRRPSLPWYRLRAPSMLP